MRSACSSAPLKTQSCVAATARSASEPGSAGASWGMLSTIPLGHLDSLELLKCSLGTLCVLVDGVVEFGNQPFRLPVTLGRKFPALANNVVDHRNPSRDDGGAVGLRPVSVDGLGDVDPGVLVADGKNKVIKVDERRALHGKFSTAVFNLVAFVTDVTEWTFGGRTRYRLVGSMAWSAPLAQVAFGGCFPASRAQALG